MTTSAKTALRTVFNIIVGVAALKMAVATIIKPIGKQVLPTNLDDVDDVDDVDETDEAVDYEALL